MPYTVADVQISAEWLIIKDRALRRSAIESVSQRCYEEEHVWELIIRMCSGKRYSFEFTDIGDTFALLVGAT